MAYQKSQSREVSSLPADEFRRLYGIGPAIERHLHNAGIRTFAQLATLSPEEIVARIPGLSAKRIAKEAWIRQAHKLILKQERDRSHKKETAVIVSRQHYANFTVEFLLSDNDEVRRTRVVHIQSEDVESWTGWEAERLIDFFARHTMARSQAAKLIPRVGATPSLVPSNTVSTKSVPEVAVTSELVQPTIPAPALVVTSAAEQIPQIASTAGPVQPVPIAAESSTPRGDLIGGLHLLNLEAVLPNTDKPQSVLPFAQAFEARLSLDLTDVQVAGNPRINYAMSIYAKNMSGGFYQTIGEAQGNVAFTHRVILITSIDALPRGLYRLEAGVTITLDTANLLQHSSLKGWLEGGLLQVY